MAASLRVLLFSRSKSLLLLALAFACWVLYTGASTSMIPSYGGCDDSNSPFMSKHYSDARRISYCVNGDADTGEMSTTWFTSQRYLTVEFSGYPNNDSVKIAIESERGSSVDLRLPIAGETWKSVPIDLGSKFSEGERIRVRAVDHSTQSAGWIGLARVESTSLPFNSRYLALLVGILVCSHLGSVTLYAFIRGRTDSKLAPLYFISFIGLAGWLAFWLFYFNRAFAIAFYAGLLAIFAYQFVSTLPRRDVLRHFSDGNALILPITTFAAFILLIGLYPYVDIDPFLSHAANRWLKLPMDNRLPKIFADQIWQGKVLTPMVGDWLSSDRPPLVSGIYLLFRWFDDDSGTVYQVLSSFLSASVFIPLVLILRAVGHARLIPLALFSIGATSLMSVHTLFVWPKLLSATYLLVVFYVLVSPDRKYFSHGQKLAIAGSGTAFAMLCHGGAVFVLPFIYGAYFLLEREGFLRKTFVLIFSVVLYVPWVVYQHYFDPPGNRLIKWHLAGNIEVNGLSTSQALVNAYQGINVFEWWSGRLSNLATVFRGDEFFWDLVSFVASDLKLHDFSTALMNLSFTNMFYSMWFFSPLIALIVWVVSKHRKMIDASSEWMSLLYISFPSILFWCFAMYIPGSSIIHQGTFAVWIMSFLFSLISVYVLNRFVFYLFVGLNLLLFVNVYVLDYVYASDGIHAEYILIAFSTFTAFIIACFHAGKRRDGQPKTKRLEGVIV